MPGYPPLLWDRFRGSDNAVGDGTQPAFVLTGEDEDRITFGDALSAIQRLLRVERESLRQWIANLGLVIIFGRRLLTRGIQAKTQRRSLDQNSEGALNPQQV